MQAPYAFSINQLGKQNYTTRNNSFQAKSAAVIRHKQLNYASLAACIDGTPADQPKLVQVVWGACGQPSLSWTNFGCQKWSRQTKPGQPKSVWSDRF